MGPLPGTYPSNAKKPSTVSAGAHEHSFTTSSEGAGQSFDILPLFYVFAFIMKM